MNFIDDLDQAFTYGQWRLTILWRASGSSGAPASATRRFESLVYRHKAEQGYCRRILRAFSISNFIEWIGRYVSLAALRGAQGRHNSIHKPVDHFDFVSNSKVLIYVHLPAGSEDLLWLHPHPYRGLTWDIVADGIEQAGIVQGRLQLIERVWSDAVVEMSKVLLEEASMHLSEPLFNLPYIHIWHAFEELM